MKAANPYGSGPRGRLIVLAVAGTVLLLLIGMALIWGGCGDSAKQGTSGDQLDDQAAGATSTTGTTGGEAMAGYTMSQCEQDMTQRYGDVEKAKQVCQELQASHGDEPVSQLPAVLPGVEQQVGATPLPGATMPTGSGGGTQPGGGGTGGGGTGGGTGGGGTGGGGGTSTNGWGGIEIQVPPAP